jgi:hypothetical protein
MLYQLNSKDYESFGKKFTMLEVQDVDKNRTTSLGALLQNN